MCGRCCEMDPILDIARRHGLRVIEDCAHAIEATYHGIPAGLMGDAGCFSFYPTKNIATGDGGMVITRDRQLYERVKVLSLHGMTADAWSRFVGGPTGYEVIAAGFKYNMTDLAASLALPQLATVEERWRRREQIWLAYNERLKQLPLLLPPPPAADSRHAYHLYTPLLELEEIACRPADDHRGARCGEHWRRHPLHSGASASLLPAAVWICRLGFPQRYICGRAHHLVAALFRHVGSRTWTTLPPR